MMAQHDVAFEIGRDADQHVRRALQQGLHLARRSSSPCHSASCNPRSGSSSGRLVRVPAIVMSRALR